MANIAERVAAITHDEAYASQLTAMITTLNLTDDDARKYFETFRIITDKSYDWSFIKLMHEIAKYEGNPRRTRIQFNRNKPIAIRLKKHDDKARSIQSDPSLKQVIASVKVEDREDEVKDVLLVKK